MNNKGLSKGRRRGSLVAALLISLTACGGRVITGPTPTAPSLAVQVAVPTLLPTLGEQVLTPAPTHTPAPTPTPLVYVIQPGDTLLGVALQYDVTLEELQQANGVLKPETLQIGQELIIPTGLSRPTGDSADGVIAPTPAPLPVRVENAARYQTPVGSLWVLGEVFNAADQPIENVQVRISLLNTAGLEIAAQANFVALESIPVGGRAPFSVSFPDAPSEVAGYHALVVRADPAYNYETRYAQLEVTDVITHPAGSQYQVTGAVRNSGRSHAKHAQLVITLYDQSGKVSGFRQYPLPDEVLVAGCFVPFFDVTLAPDPSVPTVARSMIVAEARTQ